MSSLHHQNANVSNVEGREHMARHASSDDSSNSSDFNAVDRDRYRGGSRRASAKEGKLNGIC
jgi:hypothetical protein